MFAFREFFVEIIGKSFIPNYDFVDDEILEYIVIKEAKE